MSEITGMEDNASELVPREDFARWLASDEPAARLKRWMVYRLPALGLGEAMGERLEAVYGFEPWNQPDKNAWFWGTFGSQDGSGLRRKPEAGPICLHDRATGKLYHASSNVQSLFEYADDWKKAREPERELIATLHDRAKAIVAERLTEPAIREQALKAFDDKGDEAFSKNELFELIGRAFVITGGFDKDFVADALRRSKIVEPWGPALVEWLDDEDAAARRRVADILARDAEWLGGAIRKQEEWDKAVRDHGNEVADAMDLNASMHAALQGLDAKRVDLVFDVPGGGEAVAKIERQKLLTKLAEGRQLSIASYETVQVDDCSTVLEDGQHCNRYFVIGKLKAVRFRRKDVWARDRSNNPS